MLCLFAFSREGRQKGVHEAVMHPLHHAGQSDVWSISGLWQERGSDQQLPNYLVFSLVMQATTYATACYCVRLKKVFYL